MGESKGTKEQRWQAGQRHKVGHADHMDCASIVVGRDMHLIEVTIAQSKLGCIARHFHGAGAMDACSCNAVSFDQRTQNAACSTAAQTDTWHSRRQHYLASRARACRLNVLGSNCSCLRPIITTTVLSHTLDVSSLAGTHSMGVNQLEP